MFYRHSKFKKIFFLLLPFSYGMSSLSYSQDLRWQTMSIVGEGTSALCSPNNVQTAYFGGGASFVFTNFAINLDGNATNNLRSDRDVGRCTIRSLLVIPKGTYLAGISQTTIAGVIKTKGAHGKIKSELSLQAGPPYENRRLRAFPGLKGEKGISIEREIKLRGPQEVNDPLLVLNGGFTTPEEGIKYICKFTKNQDVSIILEFTTTMVGRAVKPGSSLSVTVDSNDVQLNIGAAARRCPTR